VRGINDRAQLAAVERIVQTQTAAALMADGTSLADPARIDIRGTLTCGRDVRIDVGCVFEGRVALADGVAVGPYCVLRDATVGPGSAIAAFSHLDGATVGAGCRVGPYARLRPGAALGEDVHVGNFVEIKASTLGRGAKANHLAYIGDAEIGAGTNIGAGVITCNYDGVNKHRTTIGRHVFVGSDTQLVAPLVIGDGALIGAGSTITRDVPADALALSRTAQTNREGGAPKLRSRQKKGGLS
jgi:bifunctional UDP-N-acetylglucosamine pyrophosphorylase/glucosamine-1-phosphate N-acetyltransferase